MNDLQKAGINTKNDTYVIAEIGINHGGDIDTAKKLIESAARTGADAVKFQTYITEKRVSKDKKELFRLLKKCELPFTAFLELKSHAEKNGIFFFSTPFDEESLDYLEDINCGMYKIASFDVVNKQLLRSVAKTGKPVIMSVGMSTIAETQAALDILKQGTERISLLHCISSYPLNEADANLAAICLLRQEFNRVVGYSDHTNGIDVPVYAVAAGARIIEKHYMIEENMPCVDAAVSITELQMGNMVRQIRRLEKILGTGEMGVRQAEKEIVPFRRPSK